MHPAVQKLIEEQRAQKDQEREQILRSLGLVEEHEEREYAKGLFGDAEIARSCGYDCCEIVNGNAHYYRAKRSQTPLNLTDEEYAEVYKIYQERKAKEGQRSPVQVTFKELDAQGETAPESKFEPSFLSQAFHAFAWIFWFGGLIGAIILSFVETENYYGRVERLLQLYGIPRILRDRLLRRAALARHCARAGRAGHHRRQHGRAEVLP